MRRELGICLLVWAVVCAAATWAAAAETEGVDLGRGQKWVRSHPFTIMGVSLVERPFDVELYRNAGFTSLLVWESQEEVLRAASDAGLPWHMNRHEGMRGREPFSEKDRERIRQVVKKYSGGVGWIVNDEPGDEAEMRATAEVIDWLREEFPDMLAYSNANPAAPWHERDMLNFARILRPDVLMYDRYIFEPDNGMKEDFFWNMAFVRQIALVQGVPYWSFVQAFEAEEDADPEINGRRLPSESDLRMQVYSFLAYGYTGLAYFVYDLGGGFERGVLEVDGTPSPLYESAARLNPEVSNLGRCLRMLTSTAVQYVPAEGAECPRGTVAWNNRKYGAAPAPLDVQSPERDGLIGWFTDDDGGRYLMFVNLTHAEGMSAEEGAASFHIRFGGPGKPVTTLYRLDRESGQVEPITLETDETGASGFSLSLPGGTGDLFKIGDGKFPGLE
ncbi:MAG: hypothetical protein IT445_03255 [Phycisphaeraceae bacterium]|nr:hypothetical protein [Phycisphaeraceae bacterium]